MKRIISIFLLISFLVSVLSVLSSCSSQPDNHEHTYSENWSFSTDTHWKSSTCEHNLKKDETAHDYGDPTFTSDGKKAIYTCKVCGYMSAQDHTHTFGDWSVTKAATIFEAGQKERSCIFVGCIAKESESVPKIAVSEISVSTYPTKLEYMDGDTFDPTGIKVLAKGADGSLTDVTALVTYSKTVLAETDTSISVSYGDVSRDIIISVIGLTNHTHTTEGEWKVSVPATIFAEGQKYRECSFEGCTYKEIDTVERVAVSSISITQNPLKLEYFMGDIFNPFGITVIAIGSDNSQTDVTSLVTYDKSVLENTDTAVTVSFEGKTALIPVTVVNPISVSEALDSSNYGKDIAVEGIYVGISDEGSGYSKEILIKDINTSNIIAVRGIPYGTFPYYGYEYGDKVRFNANVVRVDYSSSVEKSQNKTYLEFAENNSTEILDTIVSRGNKVRFDLSSAVLIDSWSDMKSLFKANTVEAYTYVHVVGTAWFNTYMKASDSVPLTRFHMLSTASGLTAAKPDGTRAVGLRHNMLDVNVKSAYEYFDGLLTATDFPGVQANVDFYAVLTATNSVNYQLTIIDPSWLLGKDENVKTENYTNADVVKEVAMAYYRQGNQIFYCQKWRHENVSPEYASSQRKMMLDCSSFVNSVYYEAFGVNILGQDLLYKSPSTANYSNYAKENLGIKADVVGYWENADYQTEQEQLTLLADVYAKLQVGDVLNYRHGKSSANSGHALIYIGDGMFIHSTGSQSKTSSPSEGSDVCTDLEFINGSIGKISASELFENKDSKRYLFRNTTDDKMFNFAVIRPLENTLVPTEKTVNRMNLAGLSLEKTVSVGVSKAVNKGSIITYTLEIENYSKNEYTDVSFEDILSDKLTFLFGNEGIVVTGNKLSMKIDIGAREKRVITWSALVNDNANIGDAIESRATTLGGIDVFPTVNYVSSYTKAELAAVADKALEYANGTETYSDPIAFANKIYFDTFGVNIFELDTAKAFIESIFKARGTAFILNEESPYYSMAVPDIYSGKDISSFVDIVGMISEKDLEVADIIICELDESYSLFVYLGEGKLVKIDSNTKTPELVESETEKYISSSGKYTLSTLITNLRNYDKCVVIRPAMSER